MVSRYFCHGRSVLPLWECLGDDSQGIIHGQAQTHFSTERTNSRKAVTMFKRFTLLAIAASLVLGAGYVAAQDTDVEPDVVINLTTTFMPDPPAIMYAFVGTEGDMEGVINPDIVVKVGDVVQINLVGNPDDPMEHDFAIEAFDVLSESIHSLGEVTETSVTFTVTEAGVFEYFCTVTGHYDGGMVGSFIVEE